MKTGVIDVGGGLRGVYAAGVLDRCIADGVHFDVAIGISAGSANLSSFIAGQKMRNYPFYTQYPFRRQYMGVGQFLKNRSYLNLDYIYETLSNSDGENPLDYPAFRDSETDFYAVACNAETGETRYFDKSDFAQDDYGVLKASSAIPFVCHPYWVRGGLYYDGALGDTVPLQKAFDLGCDRVVLILTRPMNEQRLSGKDEKLARRIERKYPRAAERLRTRAERYNTGVALSKEYAAEGRVLIVSPADTGGVGTLTKDQEALKSLYLKGYQDGAQIWDYLEKGTEGSP